MKIKKLLVMLSFLICHSAICQNFFEVGYKQYNNGDYKKAKEAFDKAISKKQELAKSYMYRGGTNIFFNNLKEAKADLDKSFKLNSLNETIFFFYGQYYFALKEYKTAISKYDIAISKNKKYASAYCERGITKCEEGDCSNGMNDMNEAIRIDPKDWKLYTKRGYCKITLKQYIESIADFDASINIKPNQKAYAHKGLAYFYLKMYDLAILNFTKSLEFNPEDPEVLFYRGQSYEFQGEFENACEDYHKSNSLVKNEATTNRLKIINCN